MGTDLEKSPSYSERKKIKMQRNGHTVCVCVGGCMCVCGGGGVYVHTWKKFLKKI